MTSIKRQLLGYIFWFDLSTPLCHIKRFPSRADEKKLSSKCQIKEQSKANSLLLPSNKHTWLQDRRNTPDLHHSSILLLLSMVDRKDFDHSSLVVAVPGLGMLVLVVLAIKGIQCVIPFYALVVGGANSHSNLPVEVNRKRCSSEVDRI